MKLTNKLTKTVGRIALLGAVMLVVDSRAAEPVVQPAHPDHDSSVNVAEQATDPSAVLTQLGLFYWNTRNEDDDVISQTALFQPVLPLSKRNVFRPALPLITTPGVDGHTGIGDLFLLDAWMFQIPDATVGIGWTASLPTASQDQFGSEKYELGITALYINKQVPKNIFGILGYTLTSVAGENDRADVNKFYFQPIWLRHFDWGYIGWTDQLATVDWENDGRMSFPLGLRFGKVYKGPTPLNLAIQPYYTINESAPDEFGIKISGSFVKPGWLKH
jgi:hypothetical protein